MTFPVPERDPSLATIIRNAISSRLIDVHTAIPGKVEKVDADKGIADVKPQVKGYQMDEEGRAVPVTLPVIPNVPLVFPGGGGFCLTFPVAVGDEVLLVFSEASIDGWLENGGDTDPQDTRRHDLSDAIAIVGLKPKSKAWKKPGGTYVAIGKDDGTEQWAALANLVTEKLDALKSTVNNFIDTYKTHTHTVATTGAPAAHTGTAAPPTTPPTANSTDMAVASASVKIKG